MAKDKAENYHPVPQIRKMKEMGHGEPDGDEGAMPKSYHVFHNEDGSAHSHIHHADGSHEHTDHASAEEAHAHVGKNGPEMSETCPNCGAEMEDGECPNCGPTDGAVDQGNQV